MDKYSKFLESYNYVNPDLSYTELLEWLKKQISKGNFARFKDNSDKELMLIVKLIKPLIRMKLEMVNELAREQLRNIKGKGKNCYNLK